MNEDFRNENYRNENEVVIHSLGRSGSHAIMNWIATMYKEPVYCFNNCKIGDPFRVRTPYYKRIRRREIREFFVPIPRLRSLSETEINHLRNVHKFCLMYSYEHKDIRKLENEDPVKNRDFSVGRSKNKYNVLILRDVFNWLASWLLNPGKKFSLRLDQYPEYNILKHKDWVKHASVIPRKNYLAGQNLIERWKYYALEFLGRSDYLPEKKVVISFNQWFLDEDYRISIANSLNLKNSELSLDYAGNKSSFDRYKFSRGGVRDIKVLERWKFFKDNVVYQEILGMCPEVKELSYEIFGTPR